RLQPASVKSGSAVALLGISPSGQEFHVPGATTCSGWRAQGRVAWKIRIGLIGYRGNAPAIAAAACESTAAVQNQFLMFPSRHDFIARRQKLDVDRQPHTLI